MGVKGLRFVITGGASGIGLATAQLAAAEGAAVTIGDIADDAGNAAVEAITAAGGRAWYRHCDVTNDEHLFRLMSDASAAMGGIDVLHNNAGIHDSAMGVDVSLRGYKRGTWDRIIATNLTAAFVASQAALPYLEASSNASIVNAGSTGSWSAYPQGLAYGSTKGGIAQLTKHLAVELAPLQIRANCYCPAATNTAMTSTYLEVAEDPEALMKSLTATHLVHRLGEPIDVANLVCFLASPQAAFVNGVVWLIDGGSLAWRGTVDVLGM
jgi:NAD(P)-dependent dehydrogenase (short-subunit alcohol dehydrogenase family)